MGAGPSKVYQIIIIQTFMKSKKNRKQLREPSPRPSSRNNHALKLFHVKFDVSKNDISCFIYQNKPSREKTQRLKRTSSVAKKSTPPQKIQPTAVALPARTVQLTKDRSESPDLVRQSSNIILQKIQQKGIRFDWSDDQQDLKETNEPVQNDQSESIWSAFNSSFQKSYASTNDYPVFQETTACWEKQKHALSAYNQNPFAIHLDFICFDWRTTLMIRNIPNRYTVNELALEIDKQHADTYDFLYLPCDPKNLCNVGYGFINFVTTVHLRSFYLKFNNYIWKKYRSEKICSLTYARLQGLSELIEHFSNSKVLNQKEKKFRPIIKIDEIHRMVLEQQRK